MKKADRMARKNTLNVQDEIKKKLKDTPEQRDVVGPLVAYLVTAGWNLEQIIFGKADAAGGCATELAVAAD